MQIEPQEFVSVNRNNIAKEHICCAIADKKGEDCVSSKKAWLEERFDDGLIFYKLNQRGKVFIEYMPAEHAWYPIVADGYMHINCFWVSGQFKGKGYANRLLDKCISDAMDQGMAGVTIIASEKKRSFLSDPDYMKYKGFTAADTAKPYFVLYYLPFTKEALVPHFKECTKNGTIEESGMVLYYTNQCPHVEKYAVLIRDMARQHGTDVELKKITSMEQAQNAPAPFTTYAFFNKGKFVTNEILSGKKFEKMLEEK